MPTEVNASLQQKGRFGQIRDIEILNGKEISISTINRGKKSNSYKISLLALADKSKLRVQIPWNWGIAAIVLIAVGLIYFAIRSFMELDLGMVEFAILAIWSVMLLGCIIMIVSGIGRVRMYYARYSRVPLFSIYIGNPSTREYKQFIKTLEHVMQKCREFWELKPDQQIAGEIKTLRRLADERVINQATYEYAKSKLFSISNKKSK